MADLFLVSSDSWPRSPAKPSLPRSIPLPHAHRRGPGRRGVADTVSRALNRPEIVSEAAREKGAGGGAGHRLRAQSAGRGGLASNRSRLVALFVPTIVHSIFAETVQALMARLSQAGYQTLLGLTGYSAEQEEQLLAAVLGRKPDASC